MSDVRWNYIVQCYLVPYEYQETRSSGIRLCQRKREMRRDWTPTYRIQCRDTHRNVHCVCMSMVVHIVYGGPYCMNRIASIVDTGFFFLCARYFDESTHSAYNMKTYMYLDQLFFFQKHQTDQVHFDRS